MWLKIYLMVLRVLFGFAGKALPSLTEQNWSHAQELAATLRTSISSIAFFFSFWFEKKMVALFVVASVFGCCFFFYPWDYWWCFMLFLRASFFTLCKAIDMRSLCVLLLPFWTFLKLCCLFFLVSFFLSNDTILVWTPWKGLQWILMFGNDLPSKTCEKLFKILPCSDALREYFEGNSVSF